MEECKDALELPFNKGPLTNVHHESSTFLSIPFKRNSFLKSSLADQIKEFFIKPNAEIAPILDFKKVLMPIIVSSDLNLDMTDSLRQFFNHVELILPTENQWHILRNLRIHAGSPEASKSGLEKIALYYSRLLNLEKVFPFACQEVDQIVIII
jgi:ABC-type phosphate/phosphonate transport system substrate-binding protein